MWISSLSSRTNKKEKNDVANVVILGSGMAALGASYRLRAEGIVPILYDKNSYPGGHTASFVHKNGFIFDDGPHISFTKDKRIQELFATNVGGHFESIKAYVDNYFQGHWVKHPVQCNLHGLPVDLTVSVLEDMIRALFAPKPEHFANYAEWLIACYGRTFAEKFPMVYGLRYHTTEAENMSTDWLGNRFFRPDLGQILAGALKSTTPDFHYVDYFRYPSQGGFVSFLRPLLAAGKLHLNHEVLAVNARTRTVRFRNGTNISYEHLISSIPLPILINSIEGVPAHVREAAERLACTGCVVVNLGVNDDNISPAHWRYFYDTDIVFTRLTFPHLFSRSTVPPGHGSIMAEVYFSDKYKPLHQQPEQLIEPVIADLRRCGILADKTQIVFREAKLIRFANVIYDLERARSLKIVHDFLRDVDIHWCGRYGSWDYSWTDEAFISGERAAQRLLDGEHNGPPLAA